MTKSQSRPAAKIDPDRAQELARVRQEFDEFVYIVSHDLRAPLRAIDSLAGWVVADYADRLDEDRPDRRCVGSGP